MTCLNLLFSALFAIGAQMLTWTQSDAASESAAAPFGAPVDDQRVYVHALLEEFEYRASGSDSTSRWEGEAWVGTDTNRVWLKSEGDLNPHGDVKDGEHELLYDRPITTFFDMQAGLRLDLDSAPGRAWAAFGVEGLAPYFLHLSATAYASEGGRFAAKAQASYDLLLTQRVIVQPQLEVNAYTKQDPRRQLGSGVSDVDAGLRLRYEFSRKFAPYVGVSYQRAFARTAQYAEALSEPSKKFSVLLGIRSWF
jgi:copper resistance protein B